MKKSLRYILLLPFSALYGIITAIRNVLYNRGLLKSVQHSKAVITVGNLTVGGTGKTPHAAYLISILKEHFNTAFLSRGYKRETKGYSEAGPASTFRETGDEPLEIYQRFPEIVVAVDEDRNRGIASISSNHPETEVFVLDDAFQHRKLQPGLSVLLTRHDLLYTRDSLLPGGNLREAASGSKRADIIIVTKCPADMKPVEMKLIEHELRPALHQQIYFSTLTYGEPAPLFPAHATSNPTFSSIRKKNTAILLVTGIVSPEPLMNHLLKFTQKIACQPFADHHDFTKKELTGIEKAFNELQAAEKFIVVTAKDGARLINNPYISDHLKISIFVVPVSVAILDNKETMFIKKITDYVRENTGNS